MDLFFILLPLAVCAFAIIFYKSRGHSILILIPMLIFILLLTGMLKGKLAWFDDAVYAIISKHLSSGMTSFMKFITNLGSAGFISAASILLIITDCLHMPFGKRNNGTSNAVPENRPYGVIIGINVILIWGINELLKVIFHRVRPDVPRLTGARGYSFPSGHSIVSMAFYGLILYIYCKRTADRYKKAGAILILSSIILLIGISRIYLGVHYASDVLAGFAGGFVWLVVYINTIKKYHKLLRSKSYE